MSKLCLLSCVQSNFFIGSLNTCQKLRSFLQYKTMTAAFIAFYLHVVEKVILVHHFWRNFLAI